MMDEKSLRYWVEDRLESLIGFSEKALADFCISLAKRHARSTSLLASSLEDQGLPPSAETKRFAEELITRLPSTVSQGGSVKRSAYREQEIEAAAAARRNASYKLLLDDNDDKDADLEDRKREEKVKHKETKDRNGMDAEKRKRDERKLHRRRRDKRSESESEGESAQVSRRKSRKRPWEEDVEKETVEKRNGGKRDSVESNDSEEQRKADLEEKAEFERRLKEKDEAKTKKLLERRIPREELEESIRRRRAEEAADRAKVVEDLRKYSRQEYLKKREVAKLEDLEAELEDEKLLFSGEDLTPEERAELEYKAEVLRLAKERQRHRAEIEADDGYKMPAAYDESSAAARDARYNVLTQRYQDGEGAKASATETPWAQQEVYEAEQIKKAMVSVGSKDKKIKEQEKKYDFVMDDQIDFVEAVALAGDLDSLKPETMEERAARERAAKEAEKQSAFEKIQAERRNLPMFQYRDELLKAIEEHQILIIVGETGSGKIGNKKYSRYSFCIFRYPGTRICS